jgi:hypothetical protein
MFGEIVIQPGADHTPLVIADDAELEEENGEE